MKKVIILSILAWLFYSSITFSQEIMAGELPAEHLAVIEFSGPVDQFIKETFTNVLESELAALNRFTLINRTDITAAGEELKLNLSGLISEENAIQAGLYLAADKLVIGTINFCNITSYMKKKYVDGKERKVKIWKAELSIASKIIQVEQNVVDDGLNLYGIGESEDKNRAIHFSIYNAVAQFIHGIREAFELTARVIKRHNDEAYLNLGQSAGIKKGMLFDVYRLGDTIIDTVADKWYGRTEKHIGLVRIQQVYQSFAQAKILRGYHHIKANDIVKERFDQTIATISLAFNYTVMPVSGERNPAYPGKDIAEARYYSGSVYFSALTSYVGAEFQFGYLDMDEVGGIAGDVAFKTRLNIIREALDIYFGGGVGFTYLGYYLEDPEYVKQALSIQSSDDRVNQASFSYSGSAMLHLAVTKYFQPFLEIGWKKYLVMDHWKLTYDAGDDEKLHKTIPAEFLAYPSLDIGGLTYRAGIMINVL